MACSLCKVTGREGGGGERVKGEKELGKGEKKKKVGGGCRDDPSRAARRLDVDTRYDRENGVGESRCAPNKRA